MIHSTRSTDPVLIVGSMAFDDLELPTTNAKDVVGGSATYAALSAALFAPARVVAVVGDDFPASAVELLATRGVETSGIERAAGKTFRWVGRYAKNLTSRTTLDTQLNVFADFKPKIPASARRAPFVLLGNIHPSLQLEVLEQVEKPRLVVADTMNFWITGEPAALKKLLQHVDVLVINDEEARQLGEHHNVSRAAAAIRKMGPKHLVVKRGEYGALLFDPEGTFFAPAYPLEDVLDPTGAGDTFAGGFLGYLAHVDAKGGSVDRAAFRRAIVAGSAMASFCVEDVGPSRLLTLSGTQLRDRLTQFKQLVHVEHELDALSLLR